MRSLLFLLLAPAAYAQQEVCPGPYANQTLVADLDAVDGHISAFDTDSAREALSRIHRMLLCMEEPVDRDGLSRLGRQLSLTFFFDQDEDAMRRWGRMTKHVSPDLPWYGDMEASHPFRDAMTVLSTPELGGPDQALAVPKKGAILWNGRPATGTKLPVEMPGLVQVMDKQGALIDTWWQDGSAWPERALLDAPPTVVAPPKGWADPEPDPRHAVSAAKPLFTEAVAAPEPAPEPVADATPSWSEEEIAEATRDEEAGTYIDPFSDARKRAIRREVFENTKTNEAGDTINVRTEVMTFKRDRSEGKPITAEIYVYWSRDFPDWNPATVRAQGLADDDFLADWTDDTPPQERYRAPLVHIPVALARGYCQSFGGDLPPVSQAQVHEELKWEFRLDGTAPVRVGPKGKSQPVEPDETFDDTGFRCVQ